MARLPYVTPETMKPEIREVYARLPLKLNIFRMMPHAETCFRPLIGLGTSILGRLELSPKLRELAILRVANLSRAPYEWTQHVPIGEAVGITDDQVKALARGDTDAVCFDDEEKLVLRFTTECLGEVRVSDATFAAAAKRLGNLFTAMMPRARRPLEDQIARPITPAVPPASPRFHPTPLAGASTPAASRTPAPRSA
jgi:hypothetical protein